jgi:hypothetical protein
MDKQFTKINNYIKINFPFIGYCIWNTQIIKELTKHLPWGEIIFIEVERGTEESLYHYLKEKFNHIFLKPDTNFYSNYILDFEKTIIVKTLVSEAPIQIIKGIPTVSIEKLLVDIYTDPYLFHFRGNEMRHIFNNSFDKYNVNYSKLFRYADRKGKKGEFESYLNNYNLAIKR